MQFSTPIFSISILLGVVAAQSREVGSRDLSPQGPPALRLGAGLCCSQCWGGDRCGTMEALGPRKIWVLRAEG